MNGFAYYVPRSEREKLALRNLLVVVNEAIHYAETIGLLVGDEDGRFFFERLWLSLNKHKEEFYDDGNDQ